MSDTSQSIKMQVVILVLTACSLLIVAYSILVNVYFEKGLLLSVRHRLELEALSYARNSAKDPDVRLPEAANFKTYRGFETLPEDIRKRMDQAEVVDDDFIIVKPVNETGLFHIIFIAASDRGEELFFVYSVGDDEKAELIHAAAHSILYYAVATGLLTFLFIFVLALLMIRRISKRVQKLSDWAFKLDQDNVDTPTPECNYKELNQLATLFKRNMRRQLRGIRREQRFLRNASHELRTPVAVLQSNLDWLKRLGVEHDEKFVKPVGGMSTAVKNMKELISTFLWTDKKDLSNAQASSLQVDEVLAAILDDNAYLLVNKEVRVDSELDAVSLVTAEAPARIIWGNIIRNAFQHTFEGEVVIRLEGNVLMVRNDLPSQEEESPDSFGLGLMLIQNLVERMGWDLEIEEDGAYYSVALFMFPFNQKRD